MALVGLDGEVGRAPMPDDREELVFQNDRLRPAPRDPDPFLFSPYTTTRVGGAIRCRAKAVRPSHGRVAWRGMGETDSVRATSGWARERGYRDIRREYWFQGGLSR